jgi:predicted ATPase/DNA-binding CsgD family transcriptional regulator
MSAVTTVGAETVSEREAEVLAALADHMTNAQIAQRLHISVRTVETHVSSLLRKLGAGDRRELAGLAASRPGTPSAAPVPFAGLPHRWTTFIGREAELGEILDALKGSRMVTLLGPGGIGKTALAQVIAERVAPVFVAGGAFVDLVPVTSGFVVQAVAAALGVTERPQEPLERVVHERMREGRSLLVLDNCEHVLDAVTNFVGDLLAACPDAAVLATSRERLGVVGERVIAVPPLSVAGPDGGGAPSDAETLFVERLASGSVEAPPRAVVDEICRRLDGIPLAIELAAARSASLGVDGLLAGLDDRLRLLTSGPAGRHRSLRAVIDWSHDLLDADERALFRRLGCFAGAFDLAAATDVAGGGDTAATSDVVGRLVDKSLLIRIPGQTGSRWRMLDTVHAYAHEQLASSGEAQAILVAYLGWAAATAVALEAALEGDGWKPRFDAVADDLRAALSAVTEIGDPALGHRLAMALGHLTYARRFLVEARRHYRTAVDLAPDERAAVQALRVAATAAYAEMRGDLAFEMLMTAHRRAVSEGDAGAAAISLADAAMVAGRAPGTFADPPPHQELVALVERAQALAPADDLEAETHVTIAAAWNGRPGLTETDPALADRALQVARRLDDPVLISNALDAVASAEMVAGRYKSAQRFTAERLHLLDRMRRHDPAVGGEVADAFHMATEAALAAGDLDAALAAARASDEDSLGQGLAHFAATHFVVPLALRGDFEAALAQAEVMRDGWQRTGSPAAGWMAPSFFAVALVHGLRGEDTDSREWWALAERICVPTRRNSFSLFVEPRIALHRGDVDRARAGSAALHEPVAGQYTAYAVAAEVELAIAVGAPGAAGRLAAAAALGAENDFVAAQLLRAAGRLHDDDAELRAAAEGFRRIGARFERACTLFLVADSRAEAMAELDALGCPPPAVG